MCVCSFLGLNSTKPRRYIHTYKTFRGREESIYCNAIFGKIGCCCSTWYWYGDVIMRDGVSFVNWPSYKTRSRFINSQTLIVVHCDSAPRRVAPLICFVFTQTKGSKCRHVHILPIFYFRCGRAFRFLGQPLIKVVAHRQACCENSAMLVICDL